MAEVLAGLCAVIGGMVGGLLGVGGGIVFVPTLALLLGDSQLDASATSLLAIVPVAMLGTWRQHRNGNVELADGITIGLLSIPGVALGVLVANAVPQRALQLAFAALILFVAYRLARRALTPQAAVPPGPEPATPGD